MGRSREAMLLTEFCDKSLVSVLETRGRRAYFEEKKAVLIFRDVCNDVFTMHCQSPPIAHRNLKVENVLLGVDGAWKLYDFGSASTNHKVFDRPGEMGIQEDNIRKHTTAYRAPEKWDLYRKEVISEKVDTWALGCLIYRICYLQSAFDGESKLQVSNGNYCIPDSPKYSPSIVNLIRDMLASSPDAWPDITQVRTLPSLQLRQNATSESQDKWVPVSDMEVCVNSNSCKTLKRSLPDNGLEMDPHPGQQDTQQRMEVNTSNNDSNNTAPSNLEEEEILRQEHQRFENIMDEFYALLYS